MGFSLRQLLLFGSSGCRHTGFSFSPACGIFLHQGLIPYIGRRIPSHCTTREIQQIYHWRSKHHFPWLYWVVLLLVRALHGVSCTSIFIIGSSPLLLAVSCWRTRVTGPSSLPQLSLDGNTTSSTDIVSLPSILSEGAGWTGRSWTLLECDTFLGEGGMTLFWTFCQISKES